MRDDLIRFLPMETVGEQTLEQFHEWNVAFAIDKFKGKRRADDNVSFFNLKRHDTIHIMQTMWRNSSEKVFAYDFLRYLCMEQAIAVGMVSIVQEAWVAVVAKKEDMRKYASVSETPGREDALLVHTFARDGSARGTRWIVKLHYNPDKNRMLARDDEDITSFVGRGGSPFEPEKNIWTKETDKTPLQPSCDTAI
jgi:hypothetical protein